MRRLARSRRRRAGARPADGTRIEQLQAAATSAAELARASYLTFLLFGFYLAIIFAGTDHEQLLRATPIRLPILEVELPLMGFYWVAPGLFLVAHLNLLIQLQLLAGSLHRLDREIERLPAGEQGDARARMFPFAFAHMLIGRQHDRVEQRLLAWVVWITMVLFPLAVLLLGQIRFLPYHSAATTWCHRLLVTFDLLLLWLYWPRILDREHERRSLLAWLGHRLNPLRWPGMTWRALRVWRIAQPQLQVLRSLTALTLLLAWLAVTVPEELLAKMAVDRMIGPDGSPPLIARNLLLDNAKLLRTRPHPELIEQLGGEKAAFAKYGEGLVLKERDLRFARFNFADLRKADFVGAQLHGAQLGGAKLLGARLQGAQLQGAHLWLAQLQGAHLMLAPLQGASLASAQLQGANLREAQLQGASLASAQLQGASLRNAQLQGASLRNAQLQGADLQGARLQGADLRGAQLQGTDLRQANLWRALVDGDAPLRARWQHADLRRMSFGRIERPVEYVEQIAHGLPLSAKRRQDVAEQLRWALVDPGRAPMLVLPPIAIDEHGLAETLEHLACGDDVDPNVAFGVARRLIYNKHDARSRPHIRLVAEALLHRCPSAEPLLKPFRANLEQLLALPFDAGQAGGGDGR